MLLTRELTKIGLVLHSVGYLRLLHCDKNSENFFRYSCYKYQNLSEADRKISYLTPINLELCDNLLTEGWYRFVGAAETKMLTTRVPAVQSGWLDGAHPTVKDGEVSRTVCLSDRSTGCKYSSTISVKFQFTSTALLQEFYHALVFNKLFYCSSVWSDVATTHLLKLQAVQNFAAWIIRGLISTTA